MVINGYRLLQVVMYSYSLYMSGCLIVIYGYSWGYVIVNAPQCMEYNARVCNHKFIQHEGDARVHYTHTAQLGVH